MPTAIVNFPTGTFTQYGDLSNPASPLILGQLESPVFSVNPDTGVSTLLGGINVVLGATQADSSRLYVGGTTSFGEDQNGVGQIQVVDTSNPARFARSKEFSCIFRLTRWVWCRSVARRPSTRL
jgi:hypothetical protein